MSVATEMALPQSDNLETQQPLTGLVSERDEGQSKEKRRRRGRGGRGLWKGAL